MNGHKNRGMRTETRYFLLERPQKKGVLAAGKSALRWVQAGKYRQRAEAMAVEWQRLAKDGADGGYRLAFDRPDSWSLKYNLIWDRVLDFNMFLLSFFVFA